MTWHKPWTYAVAIIAAITAAVGTLVGIVRQRLRPPVDAGLLQPADAARPLHWAREHMPVVVLTDVDAFGWSSEVEAGCKWWNAQVGLPLFVYQGEVPTAAYAAAVLALERPGTVLVQIRAGTEGGGHTRLQYVRERGELGAAPISVGGDTPIGLRPRVIAHELGHALGLAHDEAQTSVMAPVADGTPYYVTTADRQLLHRWYR